jgi:hypothetical protein
MKELGRHQDERGFAISLDGVTTGEPQHFDVRSEPPYEYEYYLYRHDHGVIRPS